jgi:nicotinamide riboside kinase
MIVAKIALTGPHSTGKTTIVSQLKDYFEQNEHPDFGYIKPYTLQSTARVCPFPINEKATPDSQKWIFFKQALEEIQLDGILRKDDTPYIVLLDRTILDNLAYTRYHKDTCHFDGDNPFNFYYDYFKFALNIFATYDLVFLTTPLMPIKEDKVRSSSIEFQDNIYKSFCEMYENDLPLWLKRYTFYKCISFEYIIQTWLEYQVMFKYET